MRQIKMQLDLFQSPADRRTSEAAMDHMLEALTLANQGYIRNNPHAPNPFTSGVRYRMEPRGLEEWRTIPYAQAAGTSDCEDLASWLTAWLRENVPGMERAQTIALPPKQRGNTLIYHIVTKLPDGRIIDPSRGLGMGAVA